MTGKSDVIEIGSKQDLNRLERFIDEILDYNNIPGEYFGNIFLAVTEAAQLGLKEGKTVVVEMKKGINGISFSITRDDPHEVDLDDLDKAIAKQAIDRETFIIRSLADSAKLSEDGRTIELQFVITGINLERSLQRSDKLKSYLEQREKVVDKNE